MTTEECRTIQGCYEKIFQQRYSTDDPEYKKIECNSMIGPPCVMNCFSKRKSNDFGNHSNTWDRRSQDKDMTRNHQDYTHKRSRGYHNNNSYENRGYRENQRERDQT